MITRGDGDAKAAVANLLGELVSTPRMPGPCGKDGAFKRYAELPIPWNRPKFVYKFRTAGKPEPTVMAANRRTDGDLEPLPIRPL